MASPGPSGNKLSEMLRASSQPGSAQHYQEQMESQQQRMAVMAAVSAGTKFPPFCRVAQYCQELKIANSE